MGIAMIYGDEHHILRKEIELEWGSINEILGNLQQETYLLGPLRQTTLFVPTGSQLRPEERAEIKCSENLATRYSVLFLLFSPLHDQCAVKVDDLIVEPLARPKLHKIVVADLLAHTLADNTLLAKELVDLSLIFSR